MKNFPLVRVEWIDAVKGDAASTYDLEEATNVTEKDSMLTTVGFELRNDDEWLVVTHELTNENTQCRGYTAIPKRWVVKRVKVR